MWMLWTIYALPFLSFVATYEMANAGSGPLKWNKHTKSEWISQKNLNIDTWLQIVLQIWLQVNGNSLLGAEHSGKGDCILDPKWQEHQFSLWLPCQWCCRSSWMLCCVNEIGIYRFVLNALSCKLYLKRLQSKQTCQTVSLCRLTLGYKLTSWNLLNVKGRNEGKQWTIMILCLVRK